MLNYSFNGSLNLVEADINPFGVDLTQFTIFISKNLFPCPSTSGQPSTIPEYYIPPAPPPPPPAIPSAQTAFDSAAAPPAASAVPPTSSALSRPYSPSPPPPPANYVPSPAHPPSGAPPAAPPPPPPGATSNLQAHPSPPHAALGQSAVDAAPVTRKSTMMGMIPMSDARSDLLAAIRRGKFRVRDRLRLYIKVNH